MEPTGMQAGEDLAAKGATAPRITVDDLRKKVVEEYYFTVGDAIGFIKAFGPDGEGAPMRIGKIPDDHPLNIVTICALVLNNGWTLIGKSAPASPENFDAMKGRQFAYEDALRQLWPLEGYLLRNYLHDGG